MKLSFSTLGCPKLSFRDVLSIAKDLGYNGIELRGIMQTIDAPDLKEFSEENYKATLERLEQLGLEIPILTSACKLYREEKWDATLKLAKRYVDMAKRIGTKYVRMLGDSYPAPGSHVQDEICLLYTSRGFPGMHAADLHKNHARAQADDGRSCGCVYRRPGWLWDI